ncbi:leucine-rich repeat domain-containing protein [Treponema socranskii]|uniref:leucine-rich repeat domain-containing protein n=1 Tax=Treponema socranskii TaxID=53419 RepID=UPI0028727BA1|nr:leucine-rich repeat domain-containing protein [Treponema socranskii]MDR9860262.1 leucine-rich repeat domain-containing protein [Treponema socranskii]
MKTSSKKKAHAFRGSAALVTAAVLLTGLAISCSNGSDSGGGTPPTPPPVTKYKVELDRTIGGNVKVTPALSDDSMAAENTVLTFTAEPLQGYDLEKWELDGTEVNGTKPTYTLKVTANAQIFVFFKRNVEPLPALHTVTLTEPEHGSVDTVPVIPPGHQKVPEGTELIFRAVPDAGYAVNKWTVSSGSFLLGGSPGSTNATLKITEDVTVTVTFGNVIFGVDGGNGTLKAEVDGAEIASPAQVEEDKTIVFTASPHAGYMVDTWTITGGQLLAGGNPENTTAMVKITEPITVAVSFKLRPPSTYAVIFSAEGTPPNGSISAKYKAGGAAFTSGTAVAENTVLVFTASPAAGYKVEKWTVNGTAVPGHTSNTYEHTVTQAADIRVSFVSSVEIPDTFTLSDGAEYKVVDKAQKLVIITKRGDNTGSNTVYTVNVKPEYSGITYTLTGFSEDCISGFGGWGPLEAFVLSGPSNFLSIEGGVLFDKHKTKLIRYPAGKADAPYTVPPSVKVLGDRSFYHSDNLTSLILPDGLTTVEDGGLSFCQNLKTVYIPSSLTSIGGYFLSFSKVEDVKIPEGVTELSYQFLDSCSALKTLELPASLTTPGWLFCTGCTALQSVTCKAATPPALESNAFENVILAGVTLKVPAASVSEYESAPIWKDFKKPFVGL